MKKSILATAVLAMMISGSALAKEGAYVGGSLGSAKLDPSNDSTATSFGAYGGYNFTDWFGIESSLFATTEFKQGDGVEVMGAAFSVAPRFILTLNEEFSLFAKAGLANTLVNVDTPIGDTDLDGIVFSWGVGLDWSVGEHLGLRLAYEMNDGELEHEDFSSVDVDVELSQLYLGVHYHF
ncbi:porin family protein [Ferrimonas sp. YFM]|uniref:porin family protein n=1 Tax=Ferrimonas sp. YFM TaxID=3028878 RepID=UPI0025743A59|nr:porin family protein [Ferrimonas sp. YFM]BDY06783.1 membrane protein [Ferrimonas sp. YFM]